MVPIHNIWGKYEKSGVIQVVADLEKCSFVHVTLALVWLLVIFSGMKYRLNRIKGFGSVQSLSHVRLFATPQTTAGQASLSITNSRSLLKLLSIESVMPSNHLILSCPLLSLPSIFHSIRVFSNESHWFFTLSGQVVEFQLQHQSFQWIFRVDLF